MCIQKMFVIIFLITIQLVLVLYAKSIERTVSLNRMSEINEYRHSQTEIADAQKQLKFNIDEIDEVSDRGKKRRKKKSKTKKHIKMMIPILIGALVTKALLLPIFLKALAFLSSSSFILSNLSLLLSMLIGVKLMVHNISKRSEVEVHHVETTPVVHDNNNSWRDDWDRRLNIIPVTNDFLNNNQTSYSSYTNYPYIR